MLPMTPFAVPEARLNVGNNRNIGRTTLRSVEPDRRVMPAVLSNDTLRASSMLSIWCCVFLFVFALVWPLRGWSQVEQRPDQQQSDQQTQDSQAPPQTTTESQPSEPGVEATAPGQASEGQNPDQ